jgi:hypothetical protein
MRFATLAYGMERIKSAAVPRRGISPLRGSQTV